MLVGRALDLGIDAHPVAHRIDLAEGHARLRHAPGPRVHAEEDDALLAIAKAAHVLLMRGARVFERVIDVRDRRAERQRAQGIAKCIDGGEDLIGSGHGVR